MQNIEKTDSFMTFFMEFLMQILYILNNLLQTKVN